MNWIITGYIHEQDLTGMDTYPERMILIDALEDWIHISHCYEYSSALRTPRNKEGQPLEPNRAEDKES